MREVPGIDLVMGGHEHEKVRALEKNADEKEILIAKVDANAKTAWIHQLHWNRQHKELLIQSYLQDIGNLSDSEPALQARANAWMNRAYQDFQDSGFEPTRVVYELK